MDVDIIAIDGGVRQLLYQWAQNEGGHPDAVDSVLLDLAAFSGFLMLGPEVGLRAFGQDGVATMMARLEAVLNRSPAREDDSEPLDVRLLKLILAAKLADRDITALVALDEEPD